jgi:hypothetical protein
MGEVHTVRSKFLELTAEEFQLQRKVYEPLNETYLYDEHGNTPIKFYQDHCRDLDALRQSIFRVAMKRDRRAKH